MTENFSRIPQQDVTPSKPPGGLPIAAAHQTKVLVEARQLKKQFGTHLAVKDVSFSINGGQVLGLLGPNGAGKSTSMMMIAGLLTPTSGEVWINGEPFNGKNLQQRRLFGLVPQEYAIYEELSGIDNLKFFGNLYGLRGEEVKTRCSEVLEEIGLTESAHRPAGKYSGGMKRRLNFGIALMQKPAILILDEPTLGVDPQSRARLMDCIRKQTAEGVGVIYASHYMEEVQSICERVAIIDQGVVLVNDSIHHLLSGLSADVFLYVDRTDGIAAELGDMARVGVGNDHEPAVIVSGGTPVATSVSKPQNRSQSQNRNTHRANHEPSRDVQDLGSRLQATLSKLAKLDIQVLRVETQQSNLEGLFLKLTGKRLRD